MCDIRVLSAVTATNISPWYEIPYGQVQIYVRFTEHIASTFRAETEG